MSLTYLKVCVTKLVWFFKGLKPKFTCKKRVFTMMDMHATYGTLTVQYLGMSPTGDRVGDVHADFKGARIKQALKNPARLTSAFAAYDRMLKEIKACGIDVLQCVIPTYSAYGTLGRLLRQGGFKHVHNIPLDNGEHSSVYRRYL